MKKLISFMAIVIFLGGIFVSSNSALGENNDYAIIINGDFSQGLLGWTAESHGYYSTGSPSPEGILGPDISEGYLRIGVYGGYHTVSQEISPSDVNVNLKARFRIQRWSTFGGQNGGWAAIALTYLDGNNNSLGTVYYYLNPYSTFENKPGVYWNKLGTGLPVPTDWINVDVNLKEAAENLLGIDSSEVGNVKIIAAVFGTHEDETFTIADFDDFRIAESSGEVEGTLKWAYKTGGYISYCPAIGADGTIYAGSDDGYLYALNPDGALKWRYEVGYSVRTSPAVRADGTVYFGGAEDGFTDYLYALNPDGTLKWKYKDEDGFSISPGTSLAIGSDGTIYVGVNRYLYALSPAGALKWRYEVEGELPGIDGSPTIGSDGTIYIGVSENWWSGVDYFYAVNPNGTFKWKYKTAGTVSASPAIGSDGTIYFGSGEGYFYALNPDGTLKWQYDTGGFIGASPVIGFNGTIYIHYSYEGIYGTNIRALLALNPDSTFKWRSDGVESPPAIGSDGTIYCGGAGVFYALNPGDGSIKWEHPVGGVFFYTPTIGDDGTIYVGGADGYLRAIYGLGGLASTPWPKVFHDIRNTGRAEFVSNQPPVIDSFTANPTSGATPLTVTFTSTAHDPDGSITAYKWDFDGDGTIDKTTADGSVEYTYTDSGTYNARVTIVDNEGAESSSSITITVTALKGDIDADGSVDLADAILGLQVVSGMKPQGIRSNYASSGTDVIGDNRIGIEEVIYIMQKVSGLR